ncbi:MAG: carbon-nitrogen hydrolase family protein [Thermoplasmatota archaeon]
MENALKVELVQKFHKRFDIEHNLDIITSSIKSSDADLVIFPEMFLTGYTLGDDLFKKAMNLEDPVIREIEEACGDFDKNVIFGFPERSTAVRGQIHNSACLVGASGVVGSYQKMHLVDFGPFEEYAYFTPGKAPFIADINGYRVGLLICYDIFFPELVKYYAIGGADLVVCISASPSMTRRFFESVMTARAIENTVFFAYSNLLGFDSKMDFWGGSAVIGPRGDTISKGPYYEEASVVARIDERSLLTARKNRPTIRDTRYDLLQRTADIRRGG